MHEANEFELMEALSVDRIWRGLNIQNYQGYTYKGATVVSNAP